MLDNDEEWVVHRRIYDGHVSSSRRSTWDSYDKDRRKEGSDLIERELVAGGLTLAQAWQFVEMAQEDR